MNQREKLLASVVGGSVGLILAGWGFHAVLIKPLRLVDQQIRQTREQIEKIKADRRAYFAAEDKLKSATMRTFADSIEQASAKSGEILTRHILLSGLHEDEFTRLPVGPRKLRGAQEIGWSVQGEGGLADVVDLLFILQESPQIHRVEGVSISPGEQPGLVKVRFRYLTLVIDPAPEVQRKDLTAAHGLDSPERHLLDGIAARDLLRPYIKRPPALPSGQPGVASAGSGGKPGSGPGPENFRIVSLSEWMGQPEVHVRDLAGRKTIRFQPGDSLAGGSLVCVDYRPLPLPGKEFLLSDSRVIVRIGAEFWAIERGQTFAQKHRLEPNQLPAELAKAK